MKFSVRPGDIVEVEKGGVFFLGEVSGKSAGVLDLEPLGREGVPASVKVGQVRQLWRRVRA